MCALVALVSAEDGPSSANNDWPQWRGPNRNGVSPETAWSAEGKEDPLWETEVGLGYATVSVVDGRVYTTGWDEIGGMDVIWCLDENTGEEIWTHAYAAKRWDQFHGGGTLTTPSVEGDSVYVLNREGQFTCLNSRTGKVRWERQVKKEFELELPTWGFSASPLILEEAVILNVGQILAFDKKDGELIWETETSYGHAYSTPTDCELRGRACLAVMGGAALIILERKTGKELATKEWKTEYDVNAASPVFVGDDRLMISSGYGHGAALVELGEKGMEIETLWETKRLRNKMSTSVFIGEHLYGFDDKVLKCFDLEGNEKWAQRGLGEGALSAAGERLMIITSGGELVVAQANPEEFEELSRAKVAEGRVFWSMPVLSGGRIYCRGSLGHLVARDHRIGDQ